MKSALKKFVFYGAFSAMGIFFAETSCFNMPAAVVHPLMYPAYGFLYVFFINALMKWDVKRFEAWYLYGFLVGIITETYVAKVTFFGLSPDAFRFWGIAPGAIVFVMMFYHAFFTFLAPCYMAVLSLKTPLPLMKHRYFTALLFAAPLLYTATANVSMIQRGWTAQKVLPQYFISLAALGIWLILLRKTGKIEDVLLKGNEIRNLGIATGVFYGVFALTVPEHDHGVKHLPPLIPYIVVSVIILLLLILTGKAIKTNKAPKDKAPYDPSKIDFRPFAAWVLVYFIVVAAPMSGFARRYFKIFIKLLGVFAVFGSLTGVVCFTYSVIANIRRAFFDKKSVQGE